MEEANEGDTTDAERVEKEKQEALERLAAEEEARKAEEAAKELAKKESQEAADSSQTGAGSHAQDAVTSKKRTLVVPGARIASLPTSFSKLKAFKVVEATSLAFSVGNRSAMTEDVLPIIWKREQGQLLQRSASTGTDLGQRLGKLVRGNLHEMVEGPFEVFDAPAAAWNFVDARKVNQAPLKFELETLYRPIASFERGSEQQKASQALLQTYGGSNLSRLPPEVENVLSRIGTTNHDLTRLAWRAAALVNANRRLTLDSGAKLNLTWLEGPEVVIPTAEGFPRTVAINAEEASGSALVVPTHIGTNFAPLDQLAMRVSIAQLLLASAPMVKPLSQGDRPNRLAYLYGWPELVPAGVAIYLVVPVKAMQRGLTLPREQLEAEISCYMADLGLLECFKQFLVVQSFLASVTGSAAANLGWEIDLPLSRSMGLIWAAVLFAAPVTAPPISPRDRLLIEHSNIRILRFAYDIAFGAAFRYRFGHLSAGDFENQILELGRSILNWRHLDLHAGVGRTLELLFGVKAPAWLQCCRPASFLQFAISNVTMQVHVAQIILLEGALADLDPLATFPRPMKPLSENEFLKVEASGRKHYIDVLSDAQFREMADMLVLPEFGGTANLLTFGARFISNFGRTENFLHMALPDI
eukprot:s1004_g10.t1